MLHVQKQCKRNCYKHANFKSRLKRKLIERKGCRVCEECINGKRSTSYLASQVKSNISCDGPAFQTASEMHKK